MSDLRSMVELARDPYRGLERLYRRTGSVSTSGFGPYRYTYLLGPEANRWVLANSELFSWREAFDVLTPVDGDTALIVSDGADHQRRRRLVQPAFTRRAIDGYRATFAANARVVLDGWRPGQRIDVYQEFRRAIRRATIQILFGQRLAEQEDVVGRELQVALDLLELHPMWQPVRRWLPAYRRAMIARDRVVEAIHAEIRHREPAPQDDGDMLGTLVAARDADARLTADELVDQVISLIAAGYETTSAAMAWAVRALHDNPGVLRQARADAEAGGGGYLDGVVNETLRLYPPAVLAARTTVRECEVLGTTLPAGRTVLFSPYVTQRLHELWPDPLRFDPLRWDPATTGYRKPAPHEFLPFGGGPHRCIGSVFATTELTAMLTELLRGADLRLDGSDTTATSLAAMRPKAGVPATVLTTTRAAQPSR